VLRTPWLLWPLLALPFAYLLGLGVMNKLGADPAKELVHSTGEYALWLLMLVMLARPLQFYLKRRELMLIRRPLGVACFVYLLLHLVLYVSTYLGFSMEAWLEDVVKRPYIIAGSLAFILALIMAVTSNSFSVKRLGARWQQLHRTIYIMVVLVCVHIIWQVKFDYGEVIAYSVFFLIMLLLRISTIRVFLLPIFRSK
jgi:methionine sulfoxide reductase heme-binding subunit